MKERNNLFVGVPCCPIVVHDFENLLIVGLDQGFLRGLSWACIEFWIQTGPTRQIHRLAPTASFRVIGALALKSQLRYPRVRPSYDFVGKKHIWGSPHDQGEVVHQLQTDCYPHHHHHQTATRPPNPQTSRSFPSTTRIDSALSTEVQAVAGGETSRARERSDTSHAVGRRRGNLGGGRWVAKS
jgi:hypothetical protein